MKTQINDPGFYADCSPEARAVLDKAMTAKPPLINGRNYEVGQWFKIRFPGFRQPILARIFGYSDKVFCGKRLVTRDNKAFTLSASQLDELAERCEAPQ